MSRPDLEAAARAVLSKTRPRTGWTVGDSFVVTDESDEDAPLVTVTFHNEVAALDRDGRLAVLVAALAAPLTEEEERAEFEKAWPTLQARLYTDSKYPSHMAAARLAWLARAGRSS